jgi:4-diphosphocytidyl-2C-methyl-D-erythritol kinase
MAAFESRPFRWLYIRDASNIKAPAMTAKAVAGVPPMTTPVTKTISDSRSQTLSKYLPNSEVSPLALANELREEPFPPEQLDRFAARLGADVPFFLRDGPQLGSGDGTTLDALDLPQDYWVLLVLPTGVQKRSTAEVYAAFDARNGERGYTRRRAALLESLAAVSRPRDLALLPRNDLAGSRLAEELVGLGAFRADVSGAGPVVYGLFLHADRARAARQRISPRGRTWLTAPAWYR